jgi:hypothetical protein
MATAVERVTPASAAIKNWLRAENPSVLVVSPANLRHSEDVEVLKAARTLGIKTVVPIVSWDNTSTKGLFHIYPDLMLAWNEAHRDDLVNYHHVNPRRILVTGAPFFDKWFDIAEPIEPRQPFLARIGLDPERPFVLYLGSSANIAKDETWLIRELKDAFQRHADPRLRAMQILFRPHPANWRIGLPLLQEGIAMWPREGTLPDDAASFADFRNSLEHAACVVGINTSGMLDAIVYGRAVVSPLVEMYRFTQGKAEHFVRMLQMNAIVAARDPGEAAEKVLAIVDGQDASAENRRAFVTRYLRPHRIGAGECQARAILAFASGTRIADLSLQAQSPP